MPDQISHCVKSLKTLVIVYNDWLHTLTVTYIHVWLILLCFPGDGETSNWIWTYIYKEKIGLLSSVVISDPEAYMKVIQVDGKYPNRIEMEPMVHYRKKRGMDLGTVNG